MKSARKLGIILALAGMASCETAVNKTQAGLPEAAMSPLTDLNLRRAEVPALLEAIKSPYEPIPVVTCKAIAASVTDLTNILGQDFGRRACAGGLALGAGRRRGGQRDPWRGLLDHVGLHPFPLDRARGYRGVGA